MRFLLLPAFLVLTFPILARADDECPNNKTAAACVDCLEESHWQELEKIRAAENEAKKGDKTEEEIEAIVLESTQKRIQAGFQLEKKINVCEQIVSPKNLPPKKKN